MEALVIVARLIARRAKPVAAAGMAARNCAPMRRSTRNWPRRKASFEGQLACNTTISCAACALLDPRRP
jgi:hypothetical protein